MANDGVDEMPSAVSAKRSGSVLELTEEGVFIFDEDAGGVVTWKIDAPSIVETVETDQPTVKPTTLVSFLVQHDQGRAMNCGHSVGAVCFTPQLPVRR